jgi:Transcriptional regulators containing a DNA-binding HTH domain and an aminotransferase domain (MocR family) and their eukaryotic orthologs
MDKYMLLELDGHGPQYAQLTRALQAAIADGRLSEGMRLPSTRTLALELGLSRNTVLTSYEQLRAEGCIRSQARSGNYACIASAAPATTHIPGSDIAPPSTYASRARQIHGRSSAQRHPGLHFDLSYGNAATDPTLNAAWGRELARAAIYTPSAAAHPQGVPALREQVCRHLLRNRGVHAQPEQILIVNGFQQAITLTARVLIEEDAVAVVEEPHYHRTSQALSAHGARLHPVPVDHDGLLCTALPEHAPRLVCVTPSHQFPTGAVMSLARRMELLRYIEAGQGWILEDDYDGGLRHDSRHPAALRALDRNDRVIHAGSFSMSMFPAMRLGYMMLPEPLRDDFVNAKCLCDDSSSAIDQAALARFMENGGFERHLRRTTKALRASRTALLEGLQRHVGARAQIATDHACMHLAVWLPGYGDEQLESLIAEAREHGLGLHSMASHYLQQPTKPGLLLGYGGYTGTQLREAMRIFGTCLDRVDARTRPLVAHDLRFPHCIDTVALET